MSRITPTGYIHTYLQNFINEGDTCVDATCGNGNDSLFLAKHIGRSGKLFAFDIQEVAIRNTHKLLQDNDIFCETNVILDSHENMDKYLEKESAKCVIFNLGYLPGGDHNIQTKCETSIKAIEKALDILEVGGVLAICIYHGGDSGFEERDAILGYLRELDYMHYAVIVSDYFNKPNNPPIPVLIVKER